VVSVVWTNNEFNKDTLATQNIVKPSGIAEDYARDLSRCRIKEYFLY